ncbi:MFS transporter [Neobacillus sp. 19]|uniref:MFS transporter n=1 Tax=Neobacillus sp. 19 TaxID=3394458 RepID=UPI003BF6CE0D
MKDQNANVPRQTIESATVKKVFTRLLPYLILLYIAAYISRANLGYAALGMNDDLGITARQFGLIAGIFFIGYFIFEVPSNMLLQKFGARIWIARILITWGIVAMITGFAQSVTHLYILRFLLGVAEAGFFPGVLLYLTYWFQDKDKAKAVSLFMVAIPMSYMIGAPLSGWILDHIHWLDFASWRWMFIIEGAPSVILGITTLFILPNGPKNVKWLTEEEKNWLSTTLEKENANKVKGTKGHLTKDILANKQLWALVLIYFAIEMGEYGLGYWGPQVIDKMSGHFSNTQVGLITAATYILGAIVMVYWGAHSDKTLERRNHIILPMIVCAVSIVAIGYVTNTLMSVVMLAVIIAATYALFGPFWALPSAFLTGTSAAVGLALINSFGNLAGFVSPFVIGAVAESTGNILNGFYAIAIFMVLSIVVIIFGFKGVDKGMPARSNSNIKM